MAGALDETMESLRPEASIDEVAAHLAYYNLVAAPVVDEAGHLLGAVTVDDLLDHMLPDELARPGPRSGRRPGRGASRPPEERAVASGSAPAGSTPRATAPSRAGAPPGVRRRHLRRLRRAFARFMGTAGS